MNDCQRGLATQLDTSNSVLYEHIAFVFYTVQNDHRSQNAFVLTSARE